MPETLQYIQQQVKWIEQELFTPGTVENSIWVSNAPKRDLVTKWADYLEQLHGLGVYDAPVNTISSHISARFRQNHMESAIHWARHSLDHKFKNLKYDYQMEEDMIIEGGRHDHIDSSDYRIVNEEYIGIIQNSIKVLQEFQEALEKEMPIQSYIPAPEWGEYKLRMNYSIDRLHQILDGREKVPPTTMHLLVYAKMQATLSDAYSHYVRYRKEEAELTPKQTGKILKGHVSKIALLYEPKSEQEALSAGFYGQQCEKCDSWRTEKKVNTNNNNWMLYCYSNHKPDQPQWSNLKTKIIQISN